MSGIGTTKAGMYDVPLTSALTIPAALELFRSQTVAS
jgi:hypothetical protein